MSLDQVVAFVSAATNYKDVVAVLQAVPVWKEIKDRFEAGAQSMSIEDYVREVMTS
jgi:hypothetical protein